MSATPRTDAALYPMNGVEIVWPDFARTLETELAEAKAEAAHYMSVAQKATDDLTRLRAELAVAQNWVEHHSKHADDLIGENVKLRADLERFTGHGLLDCHAICDQRDAAIAERDRLRAELKELSQAYELNRVSIDELDADRARAEKAEAEVERLTATLSAIEEDGTSEHNAAVGLRQNLVAAIARAERFEAALAEWSVLNLWGGTPEIIHEFIKGQQNRIHHCQGLEAECLEQARLLGMSGEREADLLGKLERLAKDKARLDWLEEKMWFVRANVMLHDEVPPYTVKTCDGIVHGATVRAAIDAAMSP